MVALARFVEGINVDCRAGKIRKMVHKFPVNLLCHVMRLRNRKGGIDRNIDFSLQAMS